MTNTNGMKGLNCDFKYYNANKQAFVSKVNHSVTEPKAWSVWGSVGWWCKDCQQGFGPLQPSRDCVGDCDSIMKTFKQFVNEGSYPLWTKAVTAGLVLKVRNLSNQIDREVDVAKQNVMIGQQNKLLAYLNGLGIAVGTNDQQLMTSVRSKAG